MGLLAGGRALENDEDLDDEERDEDEEEEDDDDDEPRSKRVSTAARVRELVDGGATTKAELVEDLGADASGRIDTALYVLKRDGVIRATGKGAFERVAKPSRAKPAKPNGGGQAACLARACEGRREGGGALHRADRGRRGRVLKRGRCRGAREGAREIVT